MMETIKTVLSGLIGVRRKSDHERAPLNPVHVIIVAVALRDPNAAAGLLDRLSPHAERSVLLAAAAGCLGPVALLCGQLSR